ncbi:Cell division control protein [Pleurostoma richardsiae]|uniref:Cell division control protein n=1 Tax=Pleurostoma richardsiae TaxID=41990 RepID=A0AA38RUF4_9PEZI|nr:Cell division control protein [Pleurostoma richardsiae]
MGSTTLGKRTRSSKDFVQEELPAKRTRRQTRSFRLNDENQDPSEAIEEEKENEEGDTGMYDVSAESTPSKPRVKRIRNVEPIKYRAAANTTRSVREAKEAIQTVKAPLTPSTPRHRDAFASVPVTPRHRVMSVGKVCRRLTPQTPVTPTSSQTIYHIARQIFSRSADPGQLVGRDEERGRLRDFLGRCARPRPNGCLYVSGPPGTGKSAMVNELTQETTATNPTIRKAYINCMSIKSSKDLYTTLLNLLCGEAEMSESDAVTMLQKTFLPKKASSDVFLLVLDEIDHILSLDLESLYRVFEWSLQKSSRLVLVGIANALDLTDRFLPRLKARNLKPELLPFLPYSAPQVRNIITKRLKGLLPQDTATPDYVPFFHPAAIELCSRKVSSQTGDLRKAYEICRRAIDLVESETRQKYENEAKEQALQMTPSRKVLGENTNLSSPVKGSPGKSVPSMLATSLKSLTVENAPRVTIGHLNKVTAAVFSNGTSQRLKTLNLQQKAGLCALMALEKRNREVLASKSSTPSKTQILAPTVKTLFDTYCLLCTSESVLHPLSSSEFREVMGSLETLSLVAPVDGKTGSFAIAQTPSKRGRKGAFGGSSGNGDDRRVASCVGERELEQALEGLGADILRSILSGEALD